MRWLLPALLVLTACEKKVDDGEVVSYLRSRSPAQRAEILAKASPPVETVGTIHRGDKPLTLIGDTLDVGDPVPDVELADGKLEPVRLAALRGTVVVLSVVPSIDTRVCEMQTHTISDSIPRMPPGVEVITISRDLPFAQTRFAEEAGTQTKFASDFRGGAFGRGFGVEVKETGLLARSVWVIAADGTVAYRELVDDQGTEPDYESLIQAVTRVAGAS